jgi:hypothetical protein
MTANGKRLTLRCDHCHRRADTCRRVYHLDHNLRPEYKLMCTPCRRATGWAEVDMSRPYTTASSVMGGRPW